MGERRVRNAKVEGSSPFASSQVTHFQSRSLLLVDKDSLSNRRMKMWLIAWIVAVTEEQLTAGHPCGSPRIADCGLHLV